MAKNKSNKEELEKELVDEGTMTETEDQTLTDEELEQLQGAEEVFAGGPTYSQLSEWKSRFNDEIYMSDFGDKTYLWRPIRRKEFKDLNKIEGVDEFNLEERICTLCVLWPEDFNHHQIIFGKAGVPTMLSQLITEKSGFTRPATFKI